MRVPPNIGLIICWPFVGLSDDCPRNIGSFGQILNTSSRVSVVNAPIQCRQQTIGYPSAEKLEVHDCLHGFLAGRGTGTAILEVKLAQELAQLEQEPWYGGFIDLKKAFDAMDID